MILHISCNYFATERYLQNYCLQEYFDEALNEVLGTRPPNPYAQLCNFFELKTLPEILDLKLRCIMLGRGGVGIEAVVITNRAPFVGLYPLSRYDKPSTGEALLDFSMLQKNTSETIRGMSPFDPRAVDGAVKAVKDMTPPIALAISMAVCRAGATHAQKPLYKFLAEKAKSAARLPVPCVTVLCRSAGGATVIHQTLTVVPTTPSYVSSAVECCIAATAAVIRKVGDTHMVCTVPDAGVPSAAPPASLADLALLVAQALSEERCVSDSTDAMVQFGTCRSTISF